MILGLFTGQAKSVLDLARTRTIGVGWRMEGPKTNYQRQSIESILGLGDAWVNSVSGKVRQKLQNRRRKLQNFSKIYKCLVGIYKISLKFAVIQPDQAKSHQIWSRSRQIWSRSCQIQLDLPEFRIQLQSGGLSFGEGNLPLNPPVLVLENRDPPPTYRSFGSGWNWVGVRWFGQVFELQPGLDSPK